VNDLSLKSSLSSG